MNYKDWLRDDALRLMPLNHDWLMVRRSLERQPEIPSHTPEVEEVERSWLLLLVWSFSLVKPRGKAGTACEDDSQSTSERNRIR